jgi:hypothetical protein
MPCIRRREEDPRKEFHYVPNNLVPESMVQRSLLTLEVSKDFILLLSQFLTEPLASIHHCNIPVITLIWENIRETRIDEDLNCVLIKVLR